MFQDVSYAPSWLAILPVGMPCSPLFSSQPPSLSSVNILLLCQARRAACASAVSHLSKQPILGGLWLGAQATKSGKTGHRRCGITAPARSGQAGARRAACASAVSQLSNQPILTGLWLEAQATKSGKTGHRRCGATMRARWDQAGALSMRRAPALGAEVNAATTGKVERLWFFNSSN